MNINIQNLAKRIPPALSALLILLTLVMPFIPAHAATNIIKAGTYRFNDVLSAPSANITQYIPFTVTTFDKLYSIPFTATCSRMTAGQFQYDGFMMAYMATSTEPDFSAVGISYPVSVVVYNKSSNFEIDGWNFGDYDEGIQTITISTDTEVSAEFYEWFTANTVPVGSSPAPVEITLSVKDSSGAVLKSGSGLGPASVKVQDDGLIVYFDDGEFMTYIYSGVGHFGGVRTGSTSATLYEPSSEFELTEDASLYVEVGYAVEFRDAETNELLGYNQGQLPMSIGMEAKSIYIYYENRTATVQSIAIDKGLQIAGWSTSLIYAEPQYELGEVVDFEDHVTIYIYWSDAPVTDSAPDLPIGPDSADVPDWIDPGINDVYEDIFHQKEDISSVIDKIGNIGANVSLDKYNFDMDVFIGSAFPNVSTVLSTIVGEGFMPQIWTSLGLAIIIAVILFGSDR